MKQHTYIAIDLKSFCASKKSLRATNCPVNVFHRYSEKNDGDYFCGTGYHKLI